MRSNRIKKSIIWCLGASVALAGLAVGIHKFNSPSGSSLSLSAWVADWQLQSGLRDYAAIADRLSSLHVFALYFDDKDALYFTPGLAEALPELLADELAVHPDRDGESEGSALYLTVVNDMWQEDGTTVQKDTQLVSRLLATPESRSKHAGELIAVVEEHGFDGLEIDYERIADEDWSELAAFLAELHEELAAHGKSLRVILEPRAPVERLSLPSGPDYVMMAYNLYGTHSGPGPKADLAFLRKLAARMDNVPGEPVIALASGGFAWSADGEVTALTEEEAVQLAEQAGAAERRDQASGAVMFDYADDQGVRQTVWYADADTFRLWIDTLQEAGMHRIALWRLGGWEEDTLRYVAEAE